MVQLLRIAAPVIVGVRQAGMQAELLLDQVAQTVAVRVKQGMVFALQRICAGQVLVVVVQAVIVKVAVLACGSGVVAKQLIEIGVLPGIVNAVVVGVNQGYFTVAINKHGAIKELAGQAVVRQGKRAGGGELHTRRGIVLGTIAAVVEGGVENQLGRHVDAAPGGPVGIAVQRELLEAASRIPDPQLIDLAGKAAAAQNQLGAQTLRHAADKATGGCGCGQQVVVVSQCQGQQRSVTHCGQMIPFAALDFLGGL